MLRAGIVTGCVGNCCGSDFQRNPVTPEAQRKQSATRLNTRKLVALRVAFTEFPMPPSEKRIRTLVVDDSADYLRYFCAFLETLSNVHVIAQGRSGRDAIMLAHEWMPDLVLLDVKLPEMSGLEAASRLTRELPDVIVILMSAFEGEGIWHASQQSGAFAFILKEHLTRDLPHLLELAASEKGWNLPTKNCA